MRQKERPHVVLVLVLSSRSWWTSDCFSVKRVIWDYNSPRSVPVQTLINWQMVGQGYLGQCLVDIKCSVLLVFFLLLNLDLALRLSSGVSSVHVCVWWENQVSLSVICFWSLFFIFSSSFFSPEWVCWQTLEFILSWISKPKHMLPGHGKQSK